MAKYFNKNLKYIRKIKNISQQELADKLKVDRSSISRWENEEMEATVDKAVEIANILNVPFAQFLSTDMTKLDVDAIFDLDIGISYDKVIEKQKIRDSINNLYNDNSSIDSEIDKEITNFWIEKEKQENRKKENHEKYKQILKDKGLMDDDDNIDEESLDKLLKIADMVEGLSKKKED